MEEVIASVDALRSRVDLLEKRLETAKAMVARIADLEATLKRVIALARGDGREATTVEYQMTMRAATAILENKLTR